MLMQSCCDIHTAVLPLASQGRFEIPSVHMSRPSVAYSFIVGYLGLARAQYMGRSLLTLQGKVIQFRGTLRPLRGVKICIMGGRCSSYSAAADCIDRSTSGLCVIFWEIQKQQMRFDERVTSTQANQTTHFKIFCCPSSFILQQFGIVERVLWVVSCMFMHMYSESYLQHEIYDIYIYIVTGDNLSYHINVIAPRYQDPP